MAATDKRLGTVLPFEVKMTDVTYGRLLGVIGGLLGVLAFFLTWVVIAIDFATPIVTSAFDSSRTLIQEILAGDVLGPEPSLHAFAIAAIVGVGGWGLFLAGSGVSIVRPQGGVVMFVGIVVAAAATSIMATEITALAIPAVLQMGLGIYVAFAASIIAVVGILLRKREIGA